MPQTWYLAVDMQLFVFAPLILIAIIKLPKYTFQIFAGLILLFTVIPTFIAWDFELSAS